MSSQKPSNLTWACLQPLSGGMLLGAMNAMGTNPKYVLSYKGLSDATFKSEWVDADGVFVGSKEEDYIQGIKTCGNEYNTFSYLRKKSKLPPYFVITDRGMFDDLSDDNSDLNVTIEPDENFGSPNSKLTDLHVDLMVAVPVCSGLSNATTTGDKEQRDSRNNNMKWITKFVLNKVKPKVYIFENAPGLFGKKGEPVRAMLNDMAKKYGYSVTYYKTDTLLHDNAQKRPRTFCMFWQWQNGKEQNPPLLQYENKRVNVKDFLARIPADAPQQYAPEMGRVTLSCLGFLKQYAKKQGLKNWRDLLKGTSYTGMSFIVSNGLTDEYKEFVSNMSIDDKFKEQLCRGIDHAVEKMKQGSWIFDTSLKVAKDEYLPTTFHKNTQCLIHPEKDRLLTIREMLFTMGMPNDFIFYGNNADIIHKIGQNVPVRTAQWITSEAKRILDDWDTLRGKSKNVGFIKTVTNVEMFDNTKGLSDEE